MKKLLLLAVSAMLLMATSAYAEDICFPCIGKKGCDAYFVCPTMQSECDKVQPCDVIFKICNCLDADEFQTDARVGISYTSITPGVYIYPNRTWAPDLYLTEDQPYCCTLWSGAQGGNSPVPPASGSTDADPCVEGDQDPGWAGSPVMSSPAWSTMYETATDELWPDDTAPTDFAEDLADALEACEVPSSLRFIKATTVREQGPEWFKGGYEISAADINYIWWTFSMPYLMMDWDEVAPLAGSYAQIKVELFLEDASGLICTECDIICECIVDAVRICEEDEDAMLFPYVFNEEPGWRTGIAVSNIATNVFIDDMEITFVYIDADGETFMYTVPAGDIDNQIWVGTFEDLAAAAGWDCATGAGVLYAYPNFDADGFMFMFSIQANGVFGAGSLPRMLYY